MPTKTRLFFLRWNSASSPEDRNSPISSLSKAPYTYSTQYSSRDAHAGLPAAQGGEGAGRNSPDGSGFNIKARLLRANPEELPDLTATHTGVPAPPRGHRKAGSSQTVSDGGCLNWCCHQRKPSSTSGPNDLKSCFFRFVSVLKMQNEQEAGT